MSWSAIPNIVREQEARAAAANKPNRKGAGEYKEYNMVKTAKMVDPATSRAALVSIERAAGRPWTPATEDTLMGF